MALTESYIDSIYNSASPEAFPGLINYYKFNAGIGDTLYDHSVNGNHGTINGATWVENISGCTDPVAEHYDESANVDDGSCTYPDNGDFSLRFNEGSSDDYVRLPEISPLIGAPNESFTVMVIFKEE